jgi:hypothetical protein
LTFVREYAKIRMFLRFIFAVTHLVAGAQETTA